MRTLLLMRGAPGCGKSTWIKQQGLENYALSADDIRLLYSSPELNLEGWYSISQNNDSVVWANLFKILEARMERGEFTVIDATNSKTAEMNRYKNLCETYKYRMFCVDFTDIPIAEVKKRNWGRHYLKRVPDDVIDKMYSRFATQKIPSGITMIKPDEIDKIWMRKICLDQYNKIHVIGDIHGCYTVLKQYFDNNGGLKDDEYYIFLGDFVDRGIENADVIKFLLSIYTRPNVYMLEGNHERWLQIWGHGGICQSKEFEFVTKYQLDAAFGEDGKKEVRKLYRKLGQCAYFDYRGNTYLVSHGGLSCIPDSPTLVATHQYIKGVGQYKTAQDADDAFLRNTQPNCYQIHGHRNVKGVDIVANERCFNLEGKVEMGGYLRAVQLTDDGNRVPVELKNDVFNRELIELPRPQTQETKSVGDTVLQLRDNKYIQERQFGNISSFNFTPKAFYDKVWNQQTTKARGLYVNIPKQTVVARAYDKFFNINERPETEFEMLQHTLQFPVTAYVKENGFLGIISYNEETDDLFITTKSSPDGDFAKWLREMFEAKVSPKARECIKEIAKIDKVSFVFECVDMKNDPHIIEYPESTLFLLDIVYNNMDFQRVDYDTLAILAEKLGLRVKERAYVINDWSEFFDWYYQVTNDDYLYNGRHVEGFVVEDSVGKMVKLKLAYYNFWKFMRGVSHETIRKGYISRTAALTTPLANQYYGWIKSLRESALDIDAIPKEIVTLRRMFLQSDVGRQFALENGV